MRKLNINKGNLIKDYKSGISIRQLAFKYNCSYSFARQLLKKSDVERRFSERFEKNEEYFDEINSEDKAYFLGLIYADGCNRTDRNEIKIGLQKRDAYVLEAFSDKVFHKKKELQREKRKTKSCQEIFKISIYSKKMSRRLVELGVVKEKSLILRWPKKKVIHDSLMRHFMRGLFDGDGSVYLSPDKKVAYISFSGTENMCTNFRNEILKNCLVYKSKIREHGNIKTVTFGSKYGTLDIYHYFYNGSSIFLKRKKEKFDDFLLRSFENFKKI